MKTLKYIIISILSLSLLLLPNGIYKQVNAEEIPHDLKELKKDYDAFDIKKEREKLLELGIDTIEWDLNQNTQDIVLDFDDGSKIIYSFGMVNTSIQNILKPTNNIKAITYGNHHFTKNYFYGVANAAVSLYTDVKIDGKKTNVVKSWPGFKGSFASNDKQSVKTITSQAYSPNYAITQISGQFTLRAPNVGNYYTRSYIIQMHMDGKKGYYKIIQ